MSTRVVRIAALLFVAGACSAIYLTAWFRELGLGFGSSTRAQAALLSVLIFGVGAGGVLIGRRADGYVRPFELFTRAELALGGFAAVSPGLYWLLRFLYARLGGAPVLGDRGATVLVVGVSLLAVGLPVAVIAGALGAAARSVESPEDAGRHHLALVHGGFALGASAGVALASLVMFDLLGTRLTIWTAALVNVALAIASRRFSPKLPAQVNEPLGARPIGGLPPSGGPERTMKLELAPELAPPALVLGGAVIVGFAFFLLHRVACRVLPPLLGATSYTYGLIVAVELFGVGVGGAAFALWGRTVPHSIGRLSLGCAVQGSFVALGYALGDRLAVLALLLRPLGGIGLFGHVTAWTLITAVLLLPAAIVLGIQIPLFVGLLGRGSYQAARHIGYTFAAVGAGAIGGVLAGGLAFVPMLTANGAWRLAAAMIAALGVGAMVLAVIQRQQTRRASVVTLIASAITAGSLLLARGPTAAWRHGLVGSGRADEAAHHATKNSLREWVAASRAQVEWSAEGTESGVALATHDGLALLVDGAPVADAAQGAATQIMSGLCGALLHPKPTRALVLGLGTGGAAGWLAKVSSIERVDVIEIEPALLKVAQDLRTLNQDVLGNPKVKVTIGDPREAVNGARERWDLIVSDAQSPARATQAGLFTRDFYRAAAARLHDGGIFVQRLQAYEVDGQSIRTAYATLSSVFPIVETWQSKVGDLMLVASQKTILYSAPGLRGRIAEEPFKTALASLWRVSDLEGLMAHYVAHPALALIINQQEGGDVCTDDHNTLEFAYARGIGRRLFDARELIATARARKENRPALIDGDADWARVEEQRIDTQVFERRPPMHLPDQTTAQRRWVEAHERYAAGLLDAVLPIVRSDGRQARSLVELEMIGEALADAGDAEAMGLVAKLMPVMPAEGGAIAARLYWRQGKLREAVDYMVPSFQLYQQNPWPLPAIMRRSLEVAVDIGASDKELGRALYQVLLRPFAAGMLHTERRRAVLELAQLIDWTGLCVKAIEPLEPDIPWRRRLLARRFQCYQAAGHPLAQRARRDLEDYLAAAGIPFAQGLADTAPGLADEGGL